MTSAKNPTSWDTHDDMLLRHLKEIKNLGWKEISLYFDNRTPNACQFRWRRLKSGNLKSNKSALIDVTNMHVPMNYYERNVKMGIASANSSSDASPSSGSPKGPPANDYVVQSIPISPQHQLQTTAAFAVPHPQGSFTQPALPSSYQRDVIDQSGYVANTEQETRFSRPKSFSHSMTGTFSTPSYPVNSPNSLSKYHQPLSRMNSDDENVGFIPKVIVKSRRGSSILPGPFDQSNPFQNQQLHYSTKQQNMGSGSALQSPNGSSNANSYFPAALNTTLNGSKARKNSFVNWSRRNSFNFSSTSNSRRSSIIQAPNSIGGPLPSSLSHTEVYSSNPNSRRHSVQKITDSRGSTSSITSPSAASAVYSASNNYMDTPVTNANMTTFNKTSRQASIPMANRRQSVALSTFNNKTASNYNIMPWTREEDLLLIDCHAKQMSPSEMSVVLPTKSDAEIRARLSLISQFQAPIDVQQRPILEHPRPQFPRQLSGPALQNNTVQQKGNCSNDSTVVDEVDPLIKADVNQTVTPTSESSKDVSPAPVFSPNPNDSTSSISACSSSMSMNGKHIGENCSTAVNYSVGVNDGHFPSPALSNEKLTNLNERKLPTISTLLNNAV